MKKPTVAISCGDLSGVGMEIAIAMHDTICELVEPRYIINSTLAEQAAALLHTSLPKNFHTHDTLTGDFAIRPGELDSNSATYGFNAFTTAVTLAQNGEVDAICTLPINKEAWMQANIPYHGHTDYLRHHFQRDAIMMLGSRALNVALYSEHIPLKEVAAMLSVEKLTNFLLTFHGETVCEQCAVLGLNPHAGDGGLLGDEEQIIEQAITNANEKLGKEHFIGPLVPDTAFTPTMRQSFSYYVAMYHDQGLIPLKALYFDESINVSLNLPIIRTSVDHGTAFDIAYKGVANTASYLEAIRAAKTLYLAKNRH